MAAILLFGYTLPGSRHGKNGRALLALALLQAGMVFSVATILNYALGALLSLSLGTPMLFALYAQAAGLHWRYALSGLSIAVIASIVYHMQQLDSLLTISNAPAQYVVYLAMIPITLQTVQSLLS